MHIDNTNISLKQKKILKTGKHNFFLILTDSLSNKQQLFFYFMSTFKLELLNYFLFGSKYRTKKRKPSLELQGPEKESAITRVRRLLDRSGWWFPW